MLQKYIDGFKTVIPWALRLTLTVLLWVGMITAILCLIHFVDVKNDEQVKRERASLEDAATETQKVKDEWFKDCRHDHRQYQCQVIYKQAGFQ